MAKVKTVVTTSGETAIQLDDHYSYAWIRNIGSGDCYVSVSPDIVAGADDVLSLKAGSIVRLTTKADVVYVKGATTVEVYAQNFSDCPFKLQAKGGENYITDTDYATTSKAGIVKPDGTTITADADGTLHAAAISVNSWYDVRTIVRQGLAPTVFQVGDQLTCTKGAETIVWDIVNITSDSITLLMHEPTVEMAYDAKEAIFAFPDGLAAGEYHFYIAQHSWVATDVGKTLNFTLTQAIPEGGQLVLNGAYNATLVGTTISSFAGGSSATAIETVTMTEGDSGTDLGSIDNAGSAANNSNSLQKALLGSNTWKESTQRQWLNSDKAAGSVWTPQTAFDRPPAWATNTAGFLNGMEPEFLSVVAPTTYVTCRNTVSDGGGSDTLTDKFFLPSRTEIFGTDEVSGISEGTLYQYYTNATDADRIKYRANVAKYWRLRTPVAIFSSSVRYVSTTGTLNNVSAYYAIGAAAACIIK